MEQKRKNKHGVYVGRLNPMHLGHEAVIAKMLEQFGTENSLLVLGSSTASFSQRHFFSFEERKEFVRNIFPELEIIGLPDFPTDKQWLSELDKIFLAKGFDPREIVFFGGSREDLAYFFKTDKMCQIFDRFNGTTPIISATQVRKLLASAEPVEHLLNPLIARKVKELFLQKQKQLKKK